MWYKWLYQVYVLCLYLFIEIGVFIYQMHIPIVSFSASPLFQWSDAKIQNNIAFKRIRVFVLFLLSQLLNHNFHCMLKYAPIFLLWVEMVDILRILKYDQ